MTILRILGTDAQDFETNNLPLYLRMLRQVGGHIPARVFVTPAEIRCALRNIPAPGDYSPDQTALFYDLGLMPARWNRFLSFLRCAARHGGFEVV